MTEQLDNSIVLENGQRISVDDSVVAPVGQPAIDISGNNTRVAVGNQGAIAAPDDGNTGILATGNNVEVENQGDISGAFNGISSSGNSFTLRNRNNATISSDSRAVDITDGDNILVRNSGNIVGTGNQRNGTLYVDGTVDNVYLINNRSGLIDAGVGNIGDGISVQVGATGDLINENINITNRGTIAGRGQAEFAPGEGRLTANGSSGVRFFNGSGTDQGTVTGTFINSRGASITSEVNVGFLGGFVVEDGVSYQGQVRNAGLISGPRNGLYIGNAEHQLEITNARGGRIESGSRVVNLDGDNVSFDNRGTVLGTGDQRNGTIYVDGTGDNISISNRRGGLIDAGSGNSGSGVSVQVGAAAGLSDGSDDLETSVDIVNNGNIQGRGFGNVPAGVRLFVGSGLSVSTFTGNITNQRSGLIASEQDAGILIEEGINFNGQITNEGTIRGGNGFAINAAGATGSVNVTNSRQASLEGDVVLGEGNDTFANHNSQDVNITGGGGDDVITGGSGANIYDFDLGSGKDTITDFQVTHDVLDLGAFFSDATQVLGATTQVGYDALISLGNNNSITLLNLDAANLTADNFTFA